VQLQAAKKGFEAQGLKLAAISYDSPAILKDFAEPHSIDFPLLADPKSEIIRSFGVLNTEAKGMTKGMAYPGFFYIDRTARFAKNISNRRTRTDSRRTMSSKSFSLN
jgi:peroxiredoxin